MNGSSRPCRVASGLCLATAGLSQNLTLKIFVNQCEPQNASRAEFAKNRAGFTANPTV